MAVYPKLLLRAGGGIISPRRQAKRSENTAHILIGLGGTGVDCIRTIKTQVYARLKPDDERAGQPTYQNIRFIGVDSDLTSRGERTPDFEHLRPENRRSDELLPLDDSEFFFIGNAGLLPALAIMPAQCARPDLTWFRHEDIYPLLHMDNAGAGAVRQIGRYLMMEKSENFMEKLEMEINVAKRDLRSAGVDVHIFCGLSGGTGSGCFLDVCYMIRSIAKRIPGVSIYGYFFLPDVSLEKIPVGMQDLRREISKNGYAAMQELDYCMGLPDNGGSFEQIYFGGRTIKWDRPPVDLCYLISATDQHNTIFPNAYNHALNVTAEYVMNLLTNSDTQPGVMDFLAHLHAMIGQADTKKPFGSQIAYCSIGGSCASVPLREINTYLASELFGRFGCIRQNIPGREDVERFASVALTGGAQRVSDIYMLLMHELFTNASVELYEYPEDWKYVLSNGNSAMIEHYMHQTDSQLNRVMANAKAMLSDTYEKSLIGRVRSCAEQILSDINRGPIYLYRMFSTAEAYDFLYVIDGLIAENFARWNQEAAQADLRVSDYKAAEDAFLNRRKKTIFDSDKKRFDEYQYTLKLFAQHKLTMQVYEKLDEVLQTFRAQVMEIAAPRYRKLYRVMDTLLNTFEENKAALANERMAPVTPFELSMTTIDELRQSLDAELDRINVPNMFGLFMDLLLNHQDYEDIEDPRLITKLVTDFVTEAAFPDVANKTILDFLKDAFAQRLDGAVTNVQLPNGFFEGWLKRLADQAQPLFCFKPGIWDETRTSNASYLYLPDYYAPIMTALRKINQNDGFSCPIFIPTRGAWTDRITVLRISAVFPLFSYARCDELERACYTDLAVGRYSYEGKPHPSLINTDWRQLPSLFPQSMIDVDHVPERMRTYVVEARQLFEMAREYGVLDDDGYICKPNTGVLDAIIGACRVKLAGKITGEDVAVLKSAVKELEDFDKLEMEHTSDLLPVYRSDYDINHSTIMEDIMEDYFVSSPAIHKRVRDILAEMDALQAERKSVIAAATAIIRQYEVGDGSTES